MSTERTIAASRQRPADRKQQIEVAAALAFAHDGYHGASMAAIARSVGISAPALYRHFPNKYALFLAVCSGLADRLLAVTADVADSAPSSQADARTRLDRIFTALTHVTLDTREYGGIYRWEGRYLTRDDRQVLTAAFAALRTRVRSALGVLRPELDERDADRVALATLSVIASATAHRTTPPRRRFADLLCDIAVRVTDAPVPHVCESSPSVPVLTQPAKRRDQLVAAATALFAARGYNEVTIEDIAGAVDLTASGVYRHFTGKSDILEVAFDEAAAALDAATIAVREVSSDSATACADLCLAYVRHSIDNRALMRVYFSELANLDTAARRHIRALQREHVADWAAFIQRMHPMLDAKEATVLVHAAFGVVSDQISVLDSSAEGEDQRISALMECVLSP